MIRYQIQYRPFRIDGYLNEELMVSVNKRHLLNVEFERNYIEHTNIYNKIALDSTYKYPFDIGAADDFTELFDGKVEKAPMGPRAISLDFEFPRHVELSGLPERTTQDGTIALRDSM